MFFIANLSHGGIVEICLCAWHRAQQHPSPATAFPGGLVVIYVVFILVYIVWKV